MAQNNLKKKELPWGGIIILVIGLFLLLENYYPALDFPFWQFLVILVGASIIYKHYS